MPLCRGKETIPGNCFTEETKKATTPANYRTTAATTSAHFKYSSTKGTYLSRARTRTPCQVSELLVWRYDTSSVQVRRTPSHLSINQYSRRIPLMLTRDTAAEYIFNVETAAEYLVSFICKPVRLQSASSFDSRLKMGTG